MRNLNSSRYRPTDYKKCPNQGCRNHCDKRAAMCQECHLALRRGDCGTPPDGFYTKQQIADRLGITPAALSYHIDAGRLTCVRTISDRNVGVYAAEEVEALVALVTANRERRSRQIADAAEKRAAKEKAKPASKAAPRKTEASAPAVPAPAGSPLLEAIRDGKESPVTGQKGFWIVYRPFTGEYRSLHPRGDLELGERRLLEYQRGVSSLSKAPVWNVFPAPLTGERIERLANKLEQIEKNGAARI